MIEEDDDLQFEKLIEDKRHKELMSSLNKLTTAIGLFILKSERNEDYSPIIEAINAIELSVPEVKEKENNVGVLVESINKSIASLKESISSIIPKEEQKEWIFDIKRDNKGYIQNIKAIKK